MQAENKYTNRGKHDFASNRDIAIAKDMVDTASKRCYNPIVDTVSTHREA